MGRVDGAGGRAGVRGAGVDAIRIFVYYFRFDRTFWPSFLRRFARHQYYIIKQYSKRIFFPTIEYVSGRRSRRGPLDRVFPPVPFLELRVVYKYFVGRTTKTVDVPRSGCIPVTFTAGPVVRYFTTTCFRPTERARITAVVVVPQKR